MSRVLGLSFVFLFVVGGVIADNPPMKGGAPAGSVYSPGFVLEELAQSRQELLQTRANLRRLQLELTVMKAREKALLVEEVSDLFVNEILTKDVETCALMQAMAKVDADILHIERVVTRDQAVELLNRLNEQKKNIQKDLAARKSGIATRLQKLAAEKVQRAYRGELLTLNARLEATKHAESDLVTQITHLEEQADRNDLSNESLGRRISRLEDDLKGMKSTMDEIRMLLKKGPMPKPE